MRLLQTNYCFLYQVLLHVTLLIDGRCWTEIPVGLQTLLNNGGTQSQSIRTRDACCALEYQNNVDVSKFTSTALRLEELSEVAHAKSKIFLVCATKIE